MRWTARHKAEIVKSIMMLPPHLRQQQLALTTISWDEFLDWEEDYRLHGLNGLKVTRKNPA